MGRRRRLDGRHGFLRGQDSSSDSDLRCFAPVASVHRGPAQIVEPYTRGRWSVRDPRLIGLPAVRVPSMPWLALPSAVSASESRVHEIMMSGRGSVVNTSRQPGGRRPADEKEQGAVLVVAGSAGRWPASPGSHATPTALPRSRRCGSRTRRNPASSGRWRLIPQTKTDQAPTTVAAVASRCWVSRSSPVSCLRARSAAVSSVSDAG